MERTRPETSNRARNAVMRALRSLPSKDRDQVLLEAFDRLAKTSPRLLRALLAEMNEIPPEWSAAAFRSSPAAIARNQQQAYRRMQAYLTELLESKGLAITHNLDDALSTARRISAKLSKAS